MRKVRISKRAIIAFLLIIIAVVAVTAATRRKEPSLMEKRELVFKELYSAIEEAQEAGVYQCCIEPACTMCYLNGNEWNYGNAGTCACDEFLAKGEDPCPQCKKGSENGLCESTVKETCDTEEGEF
jgi:hypothetical protein